MQIEMISIKTKNHHRKKANSIVQSLIINYRIIYIMPTHIQENTAVDYQGLFSTI